MTDQQQAIRHAQGIEDRAMTQAAAILKEYLRQRKEGRTDD